MANLTAAPAGKDAFMDALSNREGTPPADEEGRGGLDGDLEGDLEGSSAEENAFGDEPVEGLAAEDSDFRHFLDASDDDDDAATVAEEGFAARQSQGAAPERGPVDDDEERWRGSKHAAPGVIATYRHDAEVKKSLVSQKALKLVEQLRHDYNTKARGADDVKGALDDKISILRDLRKQAESGKLLDPARLSYQEREVSKGWDELAQVEKLRDQAELALHRVTDAHGKHAAKHGAENGEAKTVALDRQAKEVKRAGQVIGKDLEEKATAQRRQEAREAEAARKAENANIHQRMGKDRMARKQAGHHELMEDVEKVRASRWEHDTKRVLNLKGSMDDIQRQVQSQNERRRKKQQKVNEERAKRQQALLNEGQNPYEVWRREEMAANKEAHIEKSKQLATLRSEKLIEQLMVEDVVYKKQIEQEKVKRGEADVFQKEMGRYAREKKVAAYIRKMTIGNVDVLDPTGTALRIDASKVMIMKTHAFGLGRALPDEIQKVEQDLKAADRKLTTTVKLLSAATGGRRLPQEDEDDDHFLHHDHDAEAEEKEPLPDGKIWVPNLTVLEQQYLEKAKIRQKENICSVQRCWGKEFKGDAFLAKPSVIAFNDFEVGKKYRQVIEVTNVSLTFNQFKLLPLSDQVRDYFEIEFQPPGRMSAGVTRYITLWFCPKKSQDMVSTFPILAKTGRIDFPLTCTTKKTILTVTPQDADTNPVIDFGQVLSGENNTCVLTVKNTGALAAGFSLVPADPENDMVRMVKWTSVKQEFCAHGVTKITFTFTPVATGSFNTSLRLLIDNGGDGDARYKEEKKVLLRGSCLDVPIWVEKEEYDLKTCLYGHIFRESIIIHNRRSTAMKIEVERPRDLENELQLNPRMAFVQGNSSQAISVKFSPSLDFLTNNKKFRDETRKGEQGAFRIPVRVVGVDQVLPVCTCLVGTLTTNAIQFEPSALNFGRCYVGSSVIQRIGIVNESTLPQQFCFTRLPSTLSVKDMPTDVLEEEDYYQSGVAPVLDGGADTTIGNLLPKERRHLCVAYTPDAATEMDYKIQFKVITGSLCVRDFVIPCLGQGVSPILNLSHRQVEMASIPVDTVSRDSIVITNTSKVPQTMNLLVPPLELGCIKASPVCLTILPKQSQRVQLEFCPDEDYVNLFKAPESREAAEATPEAEGSKAASPEPPAEGEEETPSEAEEPMSPRSEHKLAKLAEIRKQGGRRWEGEDKGTVHASWKLAICVRPHGSGAVSGEPEKAASVQYLGIQTCVLPRAVRAEPPILDFGEVTAQQRVVKTLVLHNLGLDVDPQRLMMEALPENQCFTVLSAMRPVGNKPIQLTVEFHPQLVQIYQSVIQLKTQSSRVQVPLRGRGVRPVLKIDPEDGILCLGSVIYNKDCKDYVTKELKIKNESEFELTYALETLIPADPNHVGVPPFTMTPSTGTVEANGTKTVMVTFRPHRPLSVFREKVFINVPNQKVPTYVHLYGHCFKYQIYAMPGMDFVPFGRAEAQKPGAFIDALSVGIGAPPSALGAFEYPAEQLTNISLKFEQGERVKYLLVGAGVDPGTPSAPQKAAAATYDFQIVQSEFSKFFTVEAPEGAKADKVAKGPAQPGALPIKVAFKYAPEETASLTYGDVDLDLLGGIGQWITCTVKGVLAGGFVPAGKPAAQEIVIELRAYLQQI